MKCTIEHEVYVRICGNELIILCLYVDDLLITSSSKKEIKDFEGELRREFKIYDLGNI